MPRVMIKPTKWTSLFLFAPAGSGKTTLIFDLYRRNSWNILIICPLKSLEQELEEKINKLEKREVFLKALTAERVSIFLDKLKKNERENLLVVIDEIHLWNYWGDSFRPKLWECFYKVAGEGIAFIGLTATMREEYLLSWTELLGSGGYENKILDLGNGKIRFDPKSVVSYAGLSKDKFQRRILSEADSMKPCLVFCQYKSEVMALTKKFKKLDINAISCLGGESIAFLEEYNKNGAQIIFCTSVLSHGVNLGKILKVFISYEISDWDIYLQMIARGGRDGQGFEVFNYQKTSTSCWNKLKLIFFDRYLRLFYA